MEALRQILSVLVSYPALLILFSLVYAWGFERRRLFWLRLAVVPVYILLSTYNFITFRLHIINVIIWIYDVIPYINTFYIINAALCVFILKFLFKEKYSDLLFIVIIAFISEHISSHVKQLFAWIVQGHEITLPPSSMAVELVFAAALAVVIKFLLKKYFDRGLIPRRRLQIAFTLTAIAAAMGISSYIYSHELFSIESNLYEILVSLLLFFFLFSIFGYSDKEHTETVVKQLLDEQLKQTQRFNENYQFLNMKFHDLKKQVNGLEEMLGSTAQLERIKETIAVHETNLDTGSAPLNIVVREYAVTCRRKGIQFYCMADGAVIGFLSEEDIYGLFHNALSNAVEAAEVCPEGERYVSVKVHGSGAVVRIHFENSFCGAPLSRGGLPATTKKDKASHGFGMKSIRYILKKYGGNMTVSAEGGAWRLDVLLTKPK